MVRPPVQAPTLVETPEALEAMLTSLEGVPFIAVDCEMDSFYSYWGKVCLIQVGDGAREWIVDPLAMDVRPFGSLLADGDRIKLFHDAEYDVRQLKADYGFTFRGLFDTRAACALVGVKAPGLASVLGERFDVKVSKKHQRADWTIRPLPHDMLAYAQLDVAYLVQLRELLVAELEERGRTAMLDTEHSRLEVLEAAPDPYPDDGYGRIKGGHKIDPIARRRLRELYIERNRVARERDRAPFRTLNDQALLSIALDPPQQRDDLLKHKGITPRALRHIGGAIQIALERAGDMPPIDRSPPKRKGPRLDENAFERYEAMRQLRTQRSKAEDIESSLLLRKELMETLAREFPASLEELSVHMADWQLERYGDALLKAMREAPSRTR
jgi:ribonuclease D